MASKEFNSFSILLLAIVASVFVQVVISARIPFSPFCRDLRNRDLCTSMVDGANNWHDALTNAINATLTLAKQLQSRNDLIGPKAIHLSPTARTSLQGTCRESFDTTINMLQEAQIALPAHDIATLQTRFSAALDSECENELSSFGATFPIANMARELTKKLSVCLAITATNAGV